MHEKYRSKEAGEEIFQSWTIIKKEEEKKKQVK